MKQVGVMARLLVIAALLTVGALALAGCGGDDDKAGGSGSGDGKSYDSGETLGEADKVVVDSDDSFDAEQQEVIATITAFGDATANKDYKALCNDLLSEEASKIGGDCEETFSKTGEALDEFKLTIKSVKVDPDGKNASADVSVTSNVQPEAQTQALSLTKEGGEWRIQILGN